MREPDLRDARQFAANAAGAAWWYFLIRGLLLIGAGVFVLIKPNLTAVALAQILGALVFIDGALALFAGITGRTDSRGWGIFRGILMMLVGGFVLAQPALAAGIAVTTVLYIIAPFVIINGVLEIVASIRDRRDSSTERGSVFGGSLTCVFGLLLLLAPIAFGLLLVRVLGITAILIGLVLLFFARKFRALEKRISIRSA